jgi:next to BRCA1 gene 1 protein
LSCPDFDYCSACIDTAGEKHPGHRFAPIYQPIKIARAYKPTHRGIYCDGPLCANYKGYITGDRYKCAVCHDTDFCASCEALPNNGHNASHPLIKIKLPIRHVSITTQHEAENGQKLAQLGDRVTAKHAATETNRSTSTNAATQVQTVAEVDPADLASSSQTAEFARPNTVTSATKDLQAWYVSDSTPDGTKVAPNHLVSQAWTLRNPGPDTWPAGCAVYYIGGDDMRNLDVLHPSSVSAMTLANRSNVLGSPVEAGKTAVFTVLVRSPAREGRAISYWRLKTPGGVPFGHKLWVDIEVRATPVELPIRSHLLPTVPAAVEVSGESEPVNSSQDSSTMIFPKLDKESPVSSVHDVRQGEAEAVPASSVEPAPKTVEQDLLEDVESLELEDSDSDDEEFLTDEEYDILDASDEELFSEARPAASK